MLFCVPADHGLGGIAAFRASGYVGVGEPSVLHVVFDGEVDDGFFFAVVDACDACQVRLPFVGLQLFHHVHGDVFHSHVHVAAEEFLAVNQYFADALSVDGDASVFAHFSSR